MDLVKPFETGRSRSSSVGWTGPACHLHRRFPSHPVVDRPRSGAPEPLVRQLIQHLVFQVQSNSGMVQFAFGKFFRMDGWSLVAHAEPEARLLG
jgi:hypothetical protein